MKDNARGLIWSVCELTRGLDDDQVVRVLELIGRPRDRGDIMNELNEILGGYGVEAIRTEDGEWIDNYHHDIVAEYVNMGDMYVTTVVHDCRTGEFIVIDWASWMEQSGG